MNQFEPPVILKKANISLVSKKEIAIQKNTIAQISFYQMRERH